MFGVHWQRVWPLVPVCTVGGGWGGQGSHWSRGVGLAEVYAGRQAGRVGYSVESGMGSWPAGRG